MIAELRLRAFQHAVGQPHRLLHLLLHILGNRVVFLIEFLPGPLVIRGSGCCFGGVLLEQIGGTGRVLLQHRIAQALVAGADIALAPLVLLARFGDGFVVLLLDARFVGGGFLGNRDQIAQGLALHLTMHRLDDFRLFVFDRRCRLRHIRLALCLLIIIPAGGKSRFIVKNITHQMAARVGRDQLFAIASRGR